MTMDGARLKEVLEVSFLAVQVFFPLEGEGVTLLMHNNDKISRSFIISWFDASHQLSAVSIQLS
jgi:hypothetical protein